MLVKTNGRTKSLVEGSPVAQSKGQELPGMCHFHDP